MTTAADDLDIKVHINLRDPEATSDEITLETHVLGLSPYLLIKPSVTAEDDTVTRVDIDVTGAQLGLDDTEGIIGMVLAGIEEHNGLPPLRERLASVIAAAIDSDYLMLHPDTEGGVDGFVDRLVAAVEGD